MNAVKVLRLVLGITAGCWVLPCWAAEGTTAAGPVGGPDIRAAFLPGPGLYGALISLGTRSPQVRDGSGNPRAGLNAVDIKGGTAGAALLYVPDFKVFGGSVGILGVAGFGFLCGQLTSAVPSRCASGFGDSYIETNWSRFFGVTRPSRENGAYPIREGLAIATGIGVVFPTGPYNQRLQASNGVSIGKNIWDVAPSVAFTYTTPPWLAEGTEFSTKIYLNNYFKNSVSDYKSGTLLDIEFAVSEHIGRWQIGVAGYYLRQLEDDRRAGVPVAPDGRRLQTMSLGGVFNYDMPEIGSSIKLKLRTSVFAYNAGMVSSFIISISKKIF
jgi:hypothetical protein